MSAADLDVDSIREDAHRIAQEMKDRGHIASLRDLVLRNGIGLYGERAVERHLSGHGFTVRRTGENWAAIEGRLGDLEIQPPDARSPVIRLEVKCKMPGGALVRIPPMAADAAVWCQVGQSAVTVRLLGWSPLPLVDAMYPAELNVADLPAWIRSHWL